MKIFVDKPGENLGDHLNLYRGDGVVSLSPEDVSECRAYTVEHLKLEAELARRYVETDDPKVINALAPITVVDDPEVEILPDPGGEPVDDFDDDDVVVA